MATAKLTNRSATPERSKIEPTSTNIGIASKGYLPRPAKKFCGTAISPNHCVSVFASAIAADPASPIATPIGTPINIITMKARNRKLAITRAAPGG